jgi:hypothetical protein
LRQRREGLPRRNSTDIDGIQAESTQGLLREESMTGLAVALLERTIGLVARAVVRVDEINVGLSQRNALQAVTANVAWRRKWEEL